jgi:integrase
LQTDNRTTAERRAAELKPIWLREIARAQGQGMDEVERDALFLKSAIERHWPKQDVKELYAVLDRLNERLADHEWKNPKAQADLSRREGLITGRLVRTDDRLEEYLASPYAADNAPKTIDSKRSTIKALASQCRYLADIDRSAAQQWVNRQAQAPGTINRKLSEIRGYWAYLQSLQLVDGDRDPFATKRLHIPRQARKGGKRKAFTAAEMVMLHEAAIERGDQQLADLIQLAMYSGARIEELCSLRIANVHADHFEILDSKTDAGLREVPIHSRLRATVKRLLKASRDGFLLSDLPARTKYAKRGGALGHRFSRLKRAKGFGKEHVFHSIRRTVASALLEADVRRDLIDDLLGWEKPGMVGHYTVEAITLARKRRAIQKLRYPVPASPRGAGARPRR